MPQPNIVIIHCHDLGRHLGCYGRDVETPNVDAIAESGVRFDDYFATAPQCCPSRGSIMTGRYPHSNGLMGLVHRGWELHDDETALPEYLRDASYSTHLFGVQHVSSDPARIGFETVETESTRAPEVAGSFADWADSGPENGDGPFFASVGFQEPHRPLHQDHVPDAAYDRYDPADVEVPPYLPDDSAVREDLAAFNALITGAVDPAVGEVREALARNGLERDTLLVFTADHGIPFPRAKCTCFDAGLETPLLISHPGSIEPGVRDELLSNVDLLPTLLEHVGIEVPGRIQGESFRPLLKGGDHPGRERIYAEQTWHVRPMPCRAVRTREYKYVETYLSHLPQTAPEFDLDLSMAERPDRELFDLTADPAEQVNLADSEPADRASNRPVTDGVDNSDPLAALQEDLHSWMVETNDPLIEGCLPLSTHDRSRLEST